MAIITRPTDLARVQRDRFARMAVTYESAHKELCAGGEQDHRDYTSGSISTKQLAAMGHPFGRTGGQGSGTVGRGIQGSKAKFKGVGSYDTLSTNKRGVWTAGKSKQISGKGSVSPLPINKQTGRLQQSFFRTGEAGSTRTVRMGFRIPYASQVLNPNGTKRMIARGFYSKGSSMAGAGILVKRHKARSAGVVQAVRDQQRKP